MKYIRTKDNRIYKLSNGVDFRKTKETYVWCFNKRYGFNFKVDTKNILEQADTIEELIDELVVVEPNNEDCPRPYILDCFRLCVYNSWFEREKERIETGTIVVYGEIWVDGELHKVAKMNKEGVLELL